MALLFDAPLTSVFSEFDAAQAIGTSVDPRGLAAPIPERIEINAAPDGTTAAMSCITPTDALTYGGIRAEFDSTPDAAHAGGAAAERWYVWQVYFPSDFAPVETLSFMQIHDSPDGGESPVKFPNFEFMTQDGMVFVKVPLDAPSESTSTGRPFGVRVPIALNRWVTCAVHTNWSSTDASGYMDAYFDGARIGREWNRASGYADAVGPYWKLGLYDFDHGGLSKSYRAWYRNAKIYSGGHTEHEILGVAPRKPTGLLVRPFA